MKGTKFFGIGIALAACVLALLLVVEAGFVSVAWAGKPPSPPGSTKYGYAKFRDAPGDVIWSDGKGQYIDCPHDYSHADIFSEMPVLEIVFFKERVFYDSL